MIDTLKYEISFLFSKQVFLPLFFPRVSIDTSKISLSRFEKRSYERMSHPRREERILLHGEYVFRSSRAIVVPGKNPDLI